MINDRELLEAKSFIQKNWLSKVIRRAGRIFAKLKELNDSYNHKEAKVHFVK